MTTSRGDCLRRETEPTEGTLMSKPPAEQWWTINGAELLAALERAHDGDMPGVVYAELFANSETEDYA